MAYAVGAADKLPAGARRDLESFLAMLPRLITALTEAASQRFGQGWWCFFI